MVFATMQQRPSLNLSDVYELQLPSRYDIDCDVLKDEALNSCRSAAHFASVESDISLHDMFPDVDPVLVESIRCETSNVQQAVDILLSVCASFDSNDVEREPTKGWNALLDHADFPVLMRDDDWALVPITRPAACTGDTWSQRAKAVAGAQPPQTRPASRVYRPGPLSVGKCRDHHGSHQFETYADNEYDVHQSRGRHRAVNRVKYPRPLRSNRFARKAEHVEVVLEVSEDPPGCAPAWRTFRFDNRL